VHAVRGGDVAMTMVEGKVLVEDGILKTADLSAIIARIHDIAPGHFARRAEFLAKNVGTTVQWTQKSD
jgi:5-methylthioadenosine/S-adenosylhomocysteine deaminase